MRTLAANFHFTRIVATILSPTPFLAAIFILFSRIVGRLGIRYSRLSPQWCTRPLALLTL